SSACIYLTPRSTVIIILPYTTLFRSTYFVTLAGSGIETLEDLAGKKVALGPPGSGTVFNCSNILKALDIIDEIDPQMMTFADARSEEHTSELQSRQKLVCRLLLEKKK